MASDHEALSQYIQEKEDYVARVLERLGWTKEHLDANVSNMAQCPLDPGHWMPEDSLQDHIVKCRLRKAGMDFSAYECPVDPSYCYEGLHSVAQVHVDEACWNAVRAEVAKSKMQKQPLLATSREEVGPTAVWLDGTTPGAGGGEGYSADGVGQADEGVWPSSGVVMRGEEIGANQVKLVPLTKEGSSTLEDTSLLRGVPVPAEYDLVSRSVDERRVMYEHVIAVSKPLVTSSAEASVDQELLSYDFEKEVRKLKRGVEDDESGEQKTYLQRLAEQRNEKRRRQKYRSKKVYISNKSVKEIYRAIIDKRMAEFGKHSSLKHPPPGGNQHQGTSSSSSHHQWTSGGRDQSGISGERGPALGEYSRGEGVRCSSEEPQSRRKDGCGSSEPAFEDSGDWSAEVSRFDIEHRSDFDSIEGIKSDEDNGKKSPSEGGEHGHHRTVHRHKHKHSSRSQSHQRDHKHRKKNRSKDRDTSRPSSSSKRRKEEKGHLSGRRRITEGEADRVVRGDDGTADGERSGRGDDEIGDGDRVGKGTSDDGTCDRIGKSDDGTAGRVRKSDDGTADRVMKSDDGAADRVRKSDDGVADKIGKSDDGTASADRIGKSDDGSADGDRVERNNGSAAL